MLNFLKKFTGFSISIFRVTEDKDSTFYTNTTLNQKIENNKNISNNEKAVVENHIYVIPPVQ